METGQMADAGRRCQCFTKTEESIHTSRTCFFPQQLHFLGLQEVRWAGSGFSILEEGLPFPMSWMK